MMTDSELFEAEFAQPFFPLFNRGELLSGYSLSVSNTRRKTWGRGLVPQTKTGIASGLPNIRFVQPGLQQGCNPSVLPGGCLPGPIVFLIVGINPVRNSLIVCALSKSLHHIEQLILAMETARSVVAHVIGVVEFGSVDDGEGNAMLFGKGECVTLL